MIKTVIKECLFATFIVLFVSFSFMLVVTGVYEGVYYMLSNFTNTRFIDLELNSKLITTLIIMWIGLMAVVVTQEIEKRNKSTKEYEVFLKILSQQPLETLYEMAHGKEAYEKLKKQRDSK